ncbi:NAD(P)-dependent oxidoreductase [Amycolatopsis keratiniphila]|uniref:NAD(P)-dependent oxidoreductase n=1 Tax=Amycolatopsis keratiniphila TaxID=129921 RepID=UPI00087B9B56|nr:NAD(P)-binding domain-containing protein [Amycolatopsis keratiniphila]OLZ44239.1 6-phosphogluconate dehydrogenase [Amycolatopsis keratiniphila subsp. nogabecina]SDU42996.1 3-hydroxyisobutyrate dehydrogenase [Amycolatopsis keratiniphila]
MTDQNLPVTVVGLGPMGAALASVLLDRGHDVTVWNRSPGKAAPLVAKGARQADDIVDAVSASRLLVVCLADYDALYSALGPAREVLRGRVVVNLNSGTPKEANEALRWAERYGTGYLDGAIMVPPAMVGHPGSVFLYSGSAEVFEEYKETLADLGDPVHLGTEAGVAVLYNTALLSMMYSSMNGFLHAAALVGSAGVPAAEFTKLAVDWFLPSVIGQIIKAEAPTIDEGVYPGEAGSLEMNVTTLKHIIGTSQEQGVDTEIPVRNKQLLDRAVAAGFGESSYYSVIELWR